MKNILLFILLISYTLSGFSQFHSKSLKSFVKSTNIINQKYFQRSMNTNYQSLTMVEITLPNGSSTLVEQDIYSYDSFGRDLLSEEINYNTNNGSVTGKKKTEYIYDAQEGWLDYTYRYTYDTNTMQYNLASKYDVLSYNTSLRLPTEAIYAVYSSGSWFDQNKDIYTYDALGNILTEINQSWSSAWVNSGKEVNTYNPGGQIMETILSYWNNGAWEISGKETYIYDAQHRLSEKVFYQMQGGTYTNQTRNIFSYNPGGQLIQKIRQQWNSTQWEDEGKRVWTYDANNNVLDQIEYIINSGTWQEEEKLNLFNYNNAFARVDLLLPESLDAEDDDVDFFNHQVNDAANHQWVGGVWQPAINVHLTYQPISVAGIDDFTFVNIKAYPNPTTEMLFIETDKDLMLTIYDLSGKQITNKKLVIGKNTINLSDIQSGIYLSTIYSNNNSATFKIVKH